MKWGPVTENWSTVAKNVQYLQTDDGWDIGAVWYVISTGLWTCSLMGGKNMKCDCRTQAEAQEALLVLAVSARLEGS